MTVRIVRPGPARGRLRAPPSKSYTHRAFVAAFLSGRRCRIVRPLESEDTRATRLGLRALGARWVRGSDGWTVLPPRRASHATAATIDCGESGTTLRLLTAVAALQPRPVRFTGQVGLAGRPMGELYRALRSLGARVDSPPSGSALPCEIRGPLHAGETSIRGDVSSQFVSALFMVLPTLPGRSTLRISGPRVSQPYVRATRSVLAEQGIQLRASREGFAIPGGQQYTGGRLRVPGDASSAAYLWSAAAATGGDVEVVGVPTSPPQADLSILPILARMGARVRRAADRVRVWGPLHRPVSVDLTNAPDLFPLVAVLAALVAGGHSRLRGAAHLAHKESDRLVESARLAEALGALVRSRGTSLEVSGTERPKPLRLPSLRDHRLVMSAAVGALAAGAESRIGRAEAVSKSFPGFWTAMGVLTGTDGGDA